MVGFYGAIDNTEGGKTSRYNANIVIHTNLNNGAVLRNQVYYTKNKFKLYSNFTFFRFDPVNGDQIRQSENRNMMGYNGSYQKDFLLGNIKTQTKAGAQVRYDDNNVVELTRTKNRSIIRSLYFFENNFVVLVSNSHGQAICQLSIGCRRYNLFFNRQLCYNAKPVVAGCGQAFT